MDKQKLHELRVFATEIRLETLKVIASRGFGHVGGSMSMADAMAVLYGEVMHIDPKNPHWEDRDWFVLSKGHGGPVMYATLGLKGYYPMESAYTLNQPNTDFPSHTDRSKTIGPQPFGCLPNHIAGKGMIRKIREVYPQANIVAVDYDPGASKINQENRIKLMLSSAE